MAKKKELTKLNDEELIALAQEGNDEATDYILDRYKDLVSNRARLYYILGADQSDVVQEGMIGLFKAVQTYDEKREAGFKTYATLCINRQIIDAVKAANRKKHTPLNTSISIEEREDIAEAPNEGVDISMRIDEVVKKDLSDMERQVWKYYMQGLSHGEIAKKTGRETKSVYNTMERIKKKVKQSIV